MCKTLFAAVVVAVLAVPASSAAQCYADAPPLIKDTVDRFVRSWTQEANAAEIASGELSAFALLDALVGLGQARAVALFETAETSKQVGASPRSSGTTSLVERPNTAKFLALALENGALSRAQDGTRLTLSSSPYALFAWAYGDTHETYRGYEFFQRLGLAAGFDVKSPDQQVEDLDASQLREFTARFRLTPDRGPRSATFHTFWDKEVRQAVKAQLLSITTIRSELLDDDTFKTLIRDAFESRLPTATQGLTEEASIRDAILCTLQNVIVAPIRGGNPKPTAEHLAKARALVVQVWAAQLAMVQARDRIERYFEAVDNRPQASIAVSHQMPAGGTRFTDMKLIYEQKTLSPFKLILNGGASVYHSPDPAKNQETVKDVALSIGLEWARSSPFLAGTSSLDRATLTFAARFERAREKDGVVQEHPNFGVFQAKMDLPVSTGVSIPISFSFSNTAEAVSGEKKRWGKGLHFGLTFDSDKVLALARARAALLLK